MWVGRKRGAGDTGGEEEEGRRRGWRGGESPRRNWRGGGEPALHQRDKRREGECKVTLTLSTPYKCVGWMGFLLALAILTVAGLYKAFASENRGINRGGYFNVSVSINGF